MQTASGKATSLAPFWGRFPLALGEVLHFRVGACALWLERLARELRVSYCQSEDPLDTSLRVAERVERVPEQPPLAAERFALNSFGPLEVVPLLADRAVVVRTHETLHVLPEDEATLYLTTPAWLRVSAGAPQKTLFERPSFRPSDTWFGPNTREGELCYAGSTTARLSLDELSMRPGRVVTRVQIANQARTPLALDRVNLPAPALSVFAASDHRLWTEAIQIRREPDGVIRGVMIAQVPEEAAGAARLSGPRQSDEGNLFSRAFKALLG